MVNGWWSLLKVVWRMEGVLVWERGRGMRRSWWAGLLGWGSIRIRDSLNKVVLVNGDEYSRIDV